MSASKSLSISPSPSPSRSVTPSPSASKSKSKSKSKSRSPSKKKAKGKGRQVQEQDAARDEEDVVTSSAAVETMIEGIATTNEDTTIEARVATSAAEPIRAVPTWASPSAWMNALLSLWRGGKVAEVEATAAVEELLNIRERCGAVLTKGSSSSIDLESTKWLRYSVEDLTEEIDGLLRNADEVDMEIVHHLAKRLQTIETDFSPQPQQKMEPLSFLRDTTIPSLERLDLGFSAGFVNARLGYGAGSMITPRIMG